MGLTAGRNEIEAPEPENKNAGDGNNIFTVIV